MNLDFAGTLLVSKLAKINDLLDRTSTNPGRFYRRKQLAYGDVSLDQLILWSDISRSKMTLTPHVHLTQGWEKRTHTASVQLVTLHEVQCVAL